MASRDRTTRPTSWCSRSSTPPEAATLPRRNASRSWPAGGSPSTDPGDPMATAQKAMGSMQRLKEDFAAVRCVAGLFRLRAASDPQRVAALRKMGGAWKPLTWAELAGLAEEAAWGLIAVGVKPGDKISLVGATRVEWTVADLGIAHAGAVSVPIYHSNTAEEIRYIVQNSGATLVFVEDDKQLRKLREVRGQLPAVRCCVLLEGEGDGDWGLSFAQLVARGKEHKARVPGELQQRLEQQKRDELSTILYTSGTTGTPKGVMTTNDQLIFAAEAVVGTGLLRRDDAHLLFLPFAHSFAQIIKAAWFGSGLKMIYAESVDRLVDNAGETGPTVLSAVPRVYEKAFNNVVANGMAQKGLSGTLFRMAMREFEMYAKAKEKGEAYSSFPFSLARKLVFPKIKDKLSKRFGGRIHTFVSGGAPLARKIAYFFDLLGFDLLEGYGLTEAIAVTGDRRKYVSVLVTVAEDQAKKVASDGGEAAGSYRDAAQSRSVRARVQDAIDRLNSTLPSYETVKRFTILDRDFSLESGELTPTLKVKRKAATQKYKPQIDSMYEGESLD